MMDASGTGVGSTASMSSATGSTSMPPGRAQSVIDVVREKRRVAGETVAPVPTMTPVRSTVGGTSVGAVRAATTMACTVRTVSSASVGTAAGMAASCMRTT